MPDQDITISLPHQLPREEVKRRIEGEAERLLQEAGDLVDHVEQRWEGDTLHFAISAVGQSISGQVSIDEQAVHLEVALPWTLSLLAAKVRQEVEQRGRRLLEGP